MRISKWTGILGIAAILLGAGAFDRLHAFEDEFTGSTLNPWWTVEFVQNANDWDYEVSGGMLSVYDIVPDFYTSSGGCGTCYAIVDLRADFYAAENFQASIKLSWDSHGTSRDMTAMQLELRDGTDTAIAWGGYNDGWVASRGELTTYAAGTWHDTGPNSMGWSGTRWFEFIREEGVVSVYFWALPDGSDKVLYAQGTSTDAVESVVLRTFWYPKSGSESAYFGTLTADFITAQAWDSTLVSDFIRARSGSDGCTEGTGSPVDPCDPDLPPGYPTFTVRSPEPDLYEDYITIESRSAVGLQMPIHTVLTNLAPASVYAINPNGGGDRPPTGYWEFSMAEHDGTTSVDDTLDLSERISRLWQFADDGGSAFSFWVDVHTTGARGEEAPEGFGFSPGFHARTRGALETDEGFILDDGSAEIHTGSTAGTLVLANRFTLAGPTALQAVSFYTSGVAAGDAAEVVVYVDPAGTADGPDPSMEVWRSAIVLGTGGFQEVPAAGCPTLNPGGAPGAALYIGLANKASRSYSLGIDLSGPYAGASYVSVDDGLTYESLSTMPIIDGNAMIRATDKPVEPCFIGSVME